MQLSLLQAEEYQPEGQIPGLQYIPDFIPPEQATNLTRMIDSQPWLTDLKRRVQHYGWKYDYQARSINQDLWLGPLPEWLAVYAQQLFEKGIFQKPPDQVIINEYLPGQGITPHIDCVPCFGEIIASLSLGTSCIMEFTHSQTQDKASILLEPNSLIILSDEARYEWKHSIPQRKTDNFLGQKLTRGRRLSLTFRTVNLSH